MKFHLERATDGKHKWVGVFTDDDGHVKHTPFGAVGYSDFTQHKNPLRRANYLTRHRAREDWNDYKSAGALSKHLLWGPSTSLQANVSSFKRRFSLD